MESLPRVAAGRGQPTSTSLSVESLNNSEGDAESMSLVLLEQLRNGVITVNDLMVEDYRCYDTNYILFRDLFLAWWI
jgi:hypothetical protein